MTIQRTVDPYYRYTGFTAKSRGFRLPREHSCSSSSDPHLDKVALLLIAAGANASTTFTDSSLNRVPFTKSGDTQISTSTGQPLIRFDGTGDTLRVPRTTSLNPGSGTWTLEAIGRVETSSVQHGFFAAYDGSGGFGLTLYISNSTNKLVGGTWNSGAPVYCVADNVFPTTQLVHVALQRTASNTVELWQDGVKQAQTQTDSSSFLLSSGNQDPYIGSTATASMNGSIKGLRYTIGVARYSATFTPPTFFPDY